MGTAQNEKLNLSGILPLELEVVKEGDAGDISLLDNEELLITKELNKIVGEIVKITKTATLPLSQRSGDREHKIISSKIFPHKSDRFSNNSKGVEDSRKSTCPHPDWWELINLCPLRPRIYNQYFCGQPRHEHDHQLYRRPCFCGPDGLRHPEA